MRQTRLRTAAPLALALGLAACATTAPGSVENPKTPTERFATPVTATNHEIWLAVHADGLTSNQAAAIDAMLAGWREDEGGTITLKAPTKGNDAGAAYRMIESARARLSEAGVPDDLIVMEGYAFNGIGQPTLRVGYERFKVEIPTCGQNWGNVARSMTNAVQANFGCATTANLAAQIASPADLIRPRTMTPQDAARRQDVLDKYRRGAKTSSEVDATMSGAVSKAID